MMKCIALRTDGAKCTRGKSAGSDYCGTHLKQINQKALVAEEESSKNRDVWLEKVDGILFYVDKDDNLYRVEDIYQKDNPSASSCGTLVRR